LPQKRAGVDRTENKQADNFSVGQSALDPAHLSKKALRNGTKKSDDRLFVCPRKEHELTGLKVGR
jgi:hypothetical protein